MNNLRWVNQSQPQTLYLGTVLAYFRAVFIILFQQQVYGLLAADLFDNIGLGELFWDLMPLFLGVALVGGALGIANEKKWGYFLATGAAIYAAVAVLWWMQRAEAFGNTSLLIRLMFDGALVVLLLHPMSKEYRKIWFR